MNNATGVLTLTDFLLARIAEDEAEVVPYGTGRVIDCESSLGLHLLPERARRECEAKRDAIEAAWQDHERIEGEWGFSRSREEMGASNDNPGVVEALASVYADHPDYREEWKP